MDNAPKCINYYGTHESTSKICHNFQNEKDICTITSDQCISFVETRGQKNSVQSRTLTQNNRTRALNNVPTTSDNPAPSWSDKTSQRQFPPQGLSKSQHCLKFQQRQSNNRNTGYQHTTIQTQIIC